MPRVASFGSVNVDRVVRVDRETLASLAEREWFPAPGETVTVEAVPPGLDGHVTRTLLGGKGANQAVAAARAGAETALYAKVGTDHAEFDVLDSLARYGVDTDAVAVADGPTGTAYVFVAPDGENHIAVVGGANAAVDPAYAHHHVEAVRAADVLLVQNEVPHVATETLFTALAGQHDRPTVVLDPAPASGAAALLAHPCVDVVTPNEWEAAALEEPLSAFGGTVVRKRGPDPVVVEPAGDLGVGAGGGGGDSTDGGGFEVAPPTVEAVDTTGAGDVFAGYLGTELARGADLREAVEWGCVAAALSVEREGVQRAVPDRAAVADAVERWY